MRVFLAGAAGAIGRRLVPLLLADGHHVVGTTRSSEKAGELAAAGAVPVVLDVFDADATRQAVQAAGCEVLIHQLTDLPQRYDPATFAAASARNARLRIEGTRNLVAAAEQSGIRRFIVQSIAFAYAPGPLPHREDDPLDPSPARATTVDAVRIMEQAVLSARGMTGIVLRYGRLYGPATWADGRGEPPSLHVDDAAEAARLALIRGEAGIYNIAEDDGYADTAKARAQLGFAAPHRA